MEKFKIFNGKIFVDNKECDDPKKIGEAILADIRKAESQIRPMFSDYGKLVRLIDNEKETELLSEWLYKNPIKGCFPICEHKPFRINFRHTLLLISLVSMLNNGELVRTDKKEAAV
jgi:hypothetical protein